MRKYAVVIEQGEHNLSAYVPDLPGCITTGRTIEEIDRNIREAIALHLEGLREEGEPIPEPHTAVAYVELQVAVRRTYLPTICSTLREFSQTVSMSSVSGTSPRLSFTVHGLV